MFTWRDAGRCRRSRISSRGTSGASRPGRDDLPQIRQILIDTQRDVYSGVTEDEEFRQRFPWFVDHWGGHPGFSCVIARDGDEVAGFAYGAPGTEGREWWRKRLDEAPERAGTFHLSELMVRELPLP
ncbi:hypothetical protein ACIPPN_21645 [Streptomyces diastaticus]|uniref:hypothetical protein n=1 Tax=Streptomyces TaxID=1883 RepID=UPI000F9B4BB0|nr:hypothetical protein [Streptomyces rutgersensis]RPK86919.1 hypothetical protein EES47_18755 [Streptomyces sp. ADI98-12]